MSTATRMHPTRRIVNYERTNRSRRLTPRQWRRLIHKAASIPSPLDAAHAEIAAAHFTGPLIDPRPLMTAVNPA